VLAGGPRRSRYRWDDVDYELVRAPDLRRVHPDLDPESTLVPGMTALLARRRPGVVHSFLYADALAARLSRLPYVVSYGGIALPEPFRRRPIKWRMFHAATRGAGKILCPSRAAADHMKDAFGYPATVVANGLDTSPYWQPDVEREPGLVLCAATADDRRKRVAVLVDAFGLLAERADVRLVLAGAASDTTRAELLGRLSGPTRARVEFIGSVAPAELRTWYARASVTCLPSVNEAFGMVLVESLAAGTPVVGAAHGAIPEIVTPDVGATFPPEDPESCAAALGGILGAPPGPEDCRRRAANFDWQEVGPGYLSIYRGL
jgi:phosphatidylinositol alpha-mannosyltransferase